MSKDEAGEMLNEAVEKQPKAKKKGCFRTLGKVCGVLFVLFLLWYLICGRSVPLRISKETTWITEPRTADGKGVDYSRAFELRYYPPEMKTDDNGYRIIARHLGLPNYELTYFDPKANERKSYNLDQAALRAQGYEKLGLDPNNKPDMTYQSHEMAIRDHTKAVHPEDLDQQGKLWWEIYNKTMSEPWTLEEYPMLAPWVEHNFPVLDMIGEAVAKPAFFAPLVVPEGHESLQHLIELQFGSIQDYRSFAREFQARFQYRLGQGDIDGAIDDKIATQRLGRHAGRQGVLISYLVGIAIDGIGYAEGIAGNLDNQPTAEQIRRLMKLQAELPPAITMREAMESERLCILDGLQVYALGRPSSPADVMPPEFLRPFVGFGLDWNIVFRRANLYLDGTLEPKAMRPSVSEFVLSLPNRKKRSENFIDTMASQFVPAVSAAEEAQRRLDCCGNLQRITLAMLLYNAEHGTLPPACTVDENGKPLQSWRVLLLPYLGDADAAELYAKIRVDEPWDSEHNRRFHDQMPLIYRCPTAPKIDGGKPGETNYTVIVGDQTPFDRSGTGKTLGGFGPESTGMVLVAETRQGVNWMNPASDVTFEQAKEGISGQKRFDYDATNPHLPKENAIGSWHTGGANFGLRGGGVSFFSETIDTELWQNVLTGKARVE